MGRPKKETDQNWRCNCGENGKAKNQHRQKNI